MNTAKTIIISIALLLLAVNAHAQINYYLGMDYINLDYWETGDYEAELTALCTKFGFMPAPYLAFEGRFAVGIDDDTVNVLGINVDLDLDNAYGFYMLGMLPIKNVAKLYAMFGQTHGKATASAMGFSYTSSESDISYGFGAELMFNKNFAGTMEYAQYIDKSDIELSGMNFGFKIYF